MLESSPLDDPEHALNLTVSRRIWTLAAVTALLAVMESTMLLSVHQESQTSDEAYSMLAGYLHLTAGDFSICPGYPPLAKEVSAVPLLGFRPSVPPMTAAEASDFRGGRIFLYANRADRMLFAARAAMTVFPLLLAVLVFLAARELFGLGPAFIALGLVAFEPNILAHGPLVANDVALACCFFAAVYAFRRYVAKPNAWRLAFCGIAAGFTFAAKHSGVILFPILFLLALLEFLAAAAPSQGSATQTSHAYNAPGTPTRNWRRVAWRLMMALLAIAALSVAVLWSSYGFRYSAKPAASAISSSLAPVLGALPGRSAASVIALAARARLLPEAYLEGLALFYATNSRPTYLLGRLYAHGVWFYFPTTFVIKSTLGFILLLALVPLACLLGARKGRREALWMLIPAATFLIASMTSNLNIGLRHILPMYPFLAVLAAASAWSLQKKHPAWGIIIAVLVAFHIASSLRAFPNYLSYSNELWGGTSETYRVLTDSNVDWGQGLPALKRYIASHAATPCWLAYFGTVDPAYYGIPCTLLTVSSTVTWGRPLGQIPPIIHGTVFVSATEMSGQAWGPDGLNPYELFQSVHPVDCVAGSILVYKGDFQVPLASALSRLWSVVALANRGEFDAALHEAREAELLAPQSVDVQFVFGRVLKAAGRTEESNQAFANALRFAKSIHPESQTYWVPIIEREMAPR